MDSLRHFIESNGGTILVSAGECLLVRWQNPERSSYHLTTAIRRSNSENLVFKCLGQTKQDMLGKAGTEEQRQKYVADIAHGNPVVYDKSWREKVLMQENHSLVAEGDNYIITRYYTPAGISYSLEAPMHAHSCMADQFPWSRDIPESMAKQFLADPAAMLTYYRSLRQ